VNAITGDLIELARAGRFEVIAHGCNCFCTMGAGIAKGIRAAFPAAYEADCRTAPGDRAKLGTCSSATVATAAGALTVVNAYTQFDWRGPGPHLDEAALASCLRWIREHHAARRLGLPRIGAGLAGGDWERIAAIIARELAGEDVTVVTYQPPAR
jgi:O-acetyl-ADP-ribose deacetylase (regulator of RNase III)